MKESLKKNKHLKEIHLFGFLHYLLTKENSLCDDGCEILNEIFLENKNIEKLNLSCIFIIF
jgi:hypothetical protein